MDGTPAGEIAGFIGVLVAGVDVCMPVLNDPTCGGGKNAEVEGCTGAGAGVLAPLSMPRSCVFCSAVPAYPAIPFDAASFAREA
jgi:hypothetical protein